MNPDSIILYGGTFDPVHNGHIDVASYAQKKLAVDEVVFIPAKRSPHRSTYPLAGEGHRRVMLELAFADRPRWRCCCCELDRPDPSYTIETINYFREKFGVSTDIYFLAGADVLDDLLKWHRIEELIDMCKLSIMYRAGYPEPDFERFEPVLGKHRSEKLRSNVLQTPLIKVSSSEIRSRLARGQSIEGLVPPAVITYINKHKLYR
jgi:nicotinate-nucleotide adenylyltransferase